MEENLFYIDNSKLQNELSLARAHFWLQEGLNLKFFRLSVLDSQGESNLYKFLSAPGITPERIIGALKYLLSQNKRGTLDGLLCLMDIEEAGKMRILKELEEKYGD